MRPLWNGTLAFGLVVIPVRLHAATSRKTPSFNLLHKECNTPVKYMKWCPVCQKELSEDDLVRAFQYSKGEYVTLSSEEIEAVHGPSSHVIEILDFVNLEDVDPIYFEKSYFLEPREGAEKAYRLLLSSMHEEGKVAVAKVAIRARETLALVRVYEARLIGLETMFWGDEVRDGQGLSIPQAMELGDREKQMAKNLIETLSARFEPAKYRSSQREALSELIEKKIQGKEVVKKPDRPDTQVMDLMEALRQSVDLALAEKPARAKVAGGRKAAGGAPARDG